MFSRLYDKKRQYVEDRLKKYRKTKYRKQG